MSVGFGFSVGDFIAAIELVGTVVDALRTSGQAGSDYRELVGQLLSLEAALIQVKDIEFEESQYAEVIALRQAAAQCRRTIDAFWEDAKKYQPALIGTNSSSKIKDRWMKIKWAVCKKDDLAKFKADLVGHTESIQLLLITVQMKKADIQDQKQEQRQKSLAGRVQEGYFNCMQRLLIVVNQGKQLLDTTSTVLRINIKVFQIILRLQQIITAMPNQVEHQQPVYMIDALGKTCPFHLDFVRSAEALVAVLKINFRKYGSGEEKIEEGEFAIQDVATKRDIDLKRDWDLCFFPGQRVLMSIILNRALTHDIKCPKCDAPSSRSFPFPDDPDIECLVCGLKYRHIVGDDSLELAMPRIMTRTNKPEIDKNYDDDNKTIGKEKQGSPRPQTFGPSPPRLPTPTRNKRRVEEEVENFRHVRIRGLSPEVDLDEPADSPAGRAVVASTVLTSAGDGNTAAIVAGAPYASTAVNSAPISRAASVSSAPTSAPQATPRYFLPCEFAVLGCEISFRIGDHDAWIEHSISHFGKIGAPPRALCTLCDLDEAIFDSKGGNRALNWKTRMNHIAEHFEAGMKQDDVRLDFFVLEHMRENDLLSEENFEWMMKYPQRPHCDGLVKNDFKTPEILRWKPNVKLVETYDKRKEDRERRRERARRKK